MIALVLVLVLTIALAVKSCIGTMMPTAVVADSSSGNDQVVVIGKETMFLQRGTVGSRIVKWLNSGATGTRGFVVDDQAFAAESDMLTPDATARLQRLVSVMKANDELNARLLVTTYEGADAARKRELAVKRSERIRAEMIERGVPAARIMTAAMPLSRKAAKRNGPRPTILIVLSNRKASG